MNVRRYCCAPMLDRSPVILWYRLTIPWESWFTVVIRAKPYGCHDQGVLHQVLSLLVANETL